MPSKPQSLPRTLMKTFLGWILPSVFIGDESEVAKTYPLIDDFMHVLLETGYFHIQATRPDTIGECVQ